MENYVIAASNKRNGVIIIGMEKKNDFLIAKGIKFNNFQEIEQREAEIQMAVSRIKPFCQL